MKMGKNQDMSLRPADLDNRMLHPEHADSNAAASQPAAREPSAALEGSIAG